MFNFSVLYSLDLFIYMVFLAILVFLSFLCAFATMFDYLVDYFYFSLCT